MLLISVSASCSEGSFPGNYLNNEIGPITLTVNAVNDKPRSMEIVLSTATVVKIVQVEVSCNLIVMFQVPQSALLSSEQDCATEDVNSVVENIHSVIDWAVALLKKVQYLQKMT